VLGDIDDSLSEIEDILRDLWCTGDVLR
jgi:hypothetical protein